VHSLPNICYSDFLSLGWKLGVAQSEQANRLNQSFCCSLDLGHPVIELPNQGNSKSTNKKCRHLSSLLSS